MTKREIASLGCKLLAIYALIQAAQTAQTPLSWAAIYWWDGGGSFGSPDVSIARIVVAALPCAAMLGISLALWLCSETLAREMTKGEVTASQTAPLHGGEVRSIAYSVVGVFCLSQAAMQGVRLLSIVVERSSEWQQSSSLRATNLFGEFSTFLVQLVIGLWLFFGARSLARLPYALRDMGRDAEPADQTSDVQP